jgi:phage anti-repressor protein
MIDALAVVTNEAVEGVDARELHRILGVGRDFSHWICEQIARFGLVEGEDFSPFSAKSSGGRPALEYALSLNAAKLIALSQNSDAARGARAALLKIERAWNSPSAVMARALQMAHAELMRTKQEQQHALEQIAVLAPKAEAHDRLSEARGDVSLMDAGRILEQQPLKFLRRLEADRILFRGSHGVLEPFAEHRDAGRFRVRVTEVDGRAFVQTLVTPVGLQWLAARYPAPRALVSAGGAA